MVVTVGAQHRASDWMSFGGADRDRTGGLLVANQALSQLSYSPVELSAISYQPSVKPISVLLTADS